MLDLNYIRQNANLKAKDNHYTWIAPDRVIAMLDEIERLRTEIDRLTAPASEGEVEEIARLRAELKEAIRYITSAYSDEGTWHDIGAMNLVKRFDLGYRKSGEEPA